MVRWTHWGAAALLTALGITPTLADPAQDRVVFQNSCAIHQADVKETTRIGRACSQFLAGCRGRYPVMPSVAMKIAGADLVRSAAASLSHCVAQIGGRRQSGPGVGLDPADNMRGYHAWIH